MITIQKLRNLLNERNKCYAIDAQDESDSELAERQRVDGAIEHELERQFQYIVPVLEFAAKASTIRHEAQYVWDTDEIDRRKVEFTQAMDSLYDALAMLNQEAQ